MSHGIFATVVIPLAGALALSQQAAVRNAPSPVFSADIDDSSSELRPHIERFAADRGSLLRTYNLEGSPARTTRLRGFYRDWLGRLERIPFENLSRDGQVDYVLLRLYLERELHRLDFAERQREEIADLVPFAPTVLSLVEAKRGLEPPDPARAAGALDQLASTVETLRRSLETPSRSDSSPQADHRRRVLAARAADYVATLRDAVRSWAGFYLGYDPVFTWWAEQPYRRADAALEAYGNFLRQRLAGLRALASDSESAGTPRPSELRWRRAAAARPGETDDIIGDPIGRESLVAELRFELIPYSPEELLALAESQFAWCESELRRASRQMGFGEDWKQALEKVKTMYVGPGRQPQLIGDLAREAEAFLDAHALITVPSLARETWRMEMMSPERQLINPFFTGGEVIRISFPTNTMSHEKNS
ncbi:MAG: DUF885 family protein [Bryobacterales bacterium]|nr:DUF885 family protein [Bryobacteraceae bacterium]MDW8353977.1 DUF885 family protein [Bryobacterales bacterium]